MNVQVMNRLGINKNIKTNILDAGCGIGASSIYISSFFSKTIFTGCNISKKQIEKGNKLIIKKRLDEKIKLMQADFTKIPLPNSFFDGAFAIESACYSNGLDKSAFIDEMARVLKKNGKLVVADGFIKYKNKMPKWLEKLHKKNLNYWAMEELGDIDLFLQKLNDAGFKIIEVKDISWNVAPSGIYLPINSIKVLIKNKIKRKYKKSGNEFNPSPDLNSHQKNYIKATWLTFFLGFFKKYFGYYLITAQKK